MRANPSKRSVPVARAGELGARIRKARQELGLSLAAVAGDDFSRAFLSQVELGRAHPSTRTLQIIAERLQRPIEYFLHGEAVSSPALELALIEGQTRLRRGDGAGARSLIDDLLQRRPLSLDVRTRAQSILAEAVMRTGPVADAIPILDEAIRAAEAAGWAGLAVELYDRMGTAYYLLRHPHEAGRWFERARAAYESAGRDDPLLKARILGHQANLHYVAGQPHEAISEYEAAIRAAGDVLDMPRLAAIYEGLAVSHRLAGQLGSALGYAQRSLRLFETLQDVRMGAQLRSNMAEILLEQGKAQEAEALFDEGAGRLAEVGDRELLPHLLAGAAEAALEQGLLARASARLEQALHAAAASGDPLARISAERVAGRVAHAHRRPREAGAHFKRALELAAGVESTLERSRVAYDYARVLEAEGHGALAARQYRQAYEARQARPAV
ncbi:MAG TPA: tetratricopeptide repeat protein [Candidatus Eisenbacteria bacterium]|jgi:tetratricopeptide (TPR) repeat protein|nr:tetratricopeptide repeat protein [Candidatus Eisenbacteria bacterium]